jgi:hypothetical protein
VLSLVFADDEYHDVLVTNLVGTLRFLLLPNYQGSVIDRHRVTKLFARIE